MWVTTARRQSIYSNSIHLHNPFTPCVRLSEHLGGVNRLCAVPHNNTHREPRVQRINSIPQESRVRQRPRLLQGRAHRGRRHEEQIGACADGQEHRHRCRRPSALPGHSRCRRARHHQRRYLQFGEGARQDAGRRCWM